MALQWRRRCISSSISFDSHLVHIRWFIGVIGLLNRPLSIFKSCDFILYLAIAVMRWFPFMFKMYGSTHKDFFTNEYVRSLLGLSISCLHRCVNILSIESLKESMNLFVLPMCCASQACSSPVSSRADRIREHQFVNPVPSSSRESQYCGEPLSPRGSVHGLRPPGLEFRILCLEGSVISPSSGGSPGPV